MTIKRPKWDDCDEKGRMIYDGKVNADPNRPLREEYSIGAFIGGVFVNLIIEKALANDEFKAKIVRTVPDNAKLPEDLNLGDIVIIPRANMCIK